MTNSGSGRRRFAGSAGLKGESLFGSFSSEKERLPLGIFQRQAGSASEGADEVAFADGDAVVAQDIVGGGDVEDHLGEGPVEQVGVAFELQVATTEGDGDVFFLAAVDGGGRDGFDEGDGFGEAGLKFL